MRKGSSTAVLTAPNTDAELTLWTSGSAVLHDETGTTVFEALIEAEGTWIDLGGTEEEFDAAISYLDSIR